MAHVTVHLSWPEGYRPPSGARARVTVEDVTQADASSVVVGEAMLTTTRDASANLGAPYETSRRVTSILEEAERRAAAVAVAAVGVAVRDERDDDRPPRPPRGSQPDPQGP